MLNIQSAKPLATTRNLTEGVAITIALLFLPFGISRRGRAVVKNTRLLSAFGTLMLLGGIAGLTGCGSGNGFFGQPQQSYTVIVTATSGTLIHSTTVVLNLR